MNSKALPEQPHETSGTMVKVILKVLVFILVMPVILFFPAGRVDWGMAWIYLGLSQVCGNYCLTFYRRFIMVVSDPFFWALISMFGLVAACSVVVGKRPNCSGITDIRYENMGY